jgi:hypothetical protein
MSLLTIGTAAVVLYCLWALFDPLTIREIECWLSNSPMTPDRGFESHVSRRRRYIFAIVASFGLFCVSARQDWIHWNGQEPTTVKAESTPSKPQRIEREEQERARHQMEENDAYYRSLRTLPGTPPTGS